MYIFYNLYYLQFIFFPNYTFYKLYFLPINITVDAYIQEHLMKNI